MTELKRTIKMFKEGNWIVTIVKTYNKSKRDENDGFYEYWLNHEDYGHMMYIFGIPQKNWKEAKKHIKYCIAHDYLRSYSIEIQKLEVEEHYPTTNSCLFIGTIIPNNMKGVNNGNEKENEKTQGQESLHPNSK